MFEEDISGSGTMMGGQWSLAKGLYSCFGKSKNAFCFKSLVHLFSNVHVTAIP